MIAPWRSRRAQSSAQRALVRRSCVDGRCSRQFSRPLAPPWAPTQPSSVCFRPAVDCFTPPVPASQCGKGPDTYATATVTAPNARRRRPLDGILGRAYLSSGGSDGAHQVVIDAFTAVCQAPRAKSACRSRLWRPSSDHVHRADDEGGASVVDGPAALPTWRSRGSMPVHMRSVTPTPPSGATRGTAEGCMSKPSPLRAPVAPIGASRDHQDSRSAAVAYLSNEALSAAERLCDEVNCSHTAALQVASVRGFETALTAINQTLTELTACVPKDPTWSPSDAA